MTAKEWKADTRTDRRFVYELINQTDADVAQKADKTYVDTELAKKVDKAGDTMTGALTLSGAPTADLHASTKKYVDDGLSGKADTTALADYLPLTGGTLTGALTLAGAPTTDLHASTKKYVDDGLSGKADSTALASYLPLTGGTLTGALTLSGAPTANLHAATKKYVDDAKSDCVLKAGDTMTGALKITKIGVGLELTPTSGEGGEIHLNASTDETTQGGIVLDQNSSRLRVFGLDSADGASKTGGGSNPFTVDPFAKTLSGGYTVTGTVYIQKDGSSLKMAHDTTSSYSQVSSWTSDGSGTNGYLRWNSGSQSVELRCTNSSDAANEYSNLYCSGGTWGFRKINKTGSTNVSYGFDFIPAIFRIYRGPGDSSGTINTTNFAQFYQISDSSTELSNYASSAQTANVHLYSNGLIALNPGAGAANGRMEVGSSVTTINKGVGYTKEVNSAGFKVTSTIGNITYSDTFIAFSRNSITKNIAHDGTRLVLDGNAGTATKLETARNIQTNLASTSAASFDGSGNVTPGITGTLGVANGGTGQTSIAAALAALTAVSLNTAWNGSGNLGLKLYFYEGNNSSTYTLPANYVFVTTIKYSDVRGIAFAMPWNSTGTNKLWINKLHDTWRGWNEVGS